MTSGTWSLAEVTLAQRTSSSLFHCRSHDPRVVAIGPDVRVDRIRDPLIDACEEDGASGNRAWAGRLASPNVRLCGEDYDWSR